MDHAVVTTERDGVVTSMNPRGSSLPSVAIASIRCHNLSIGQLGIPFACGKIAKRCTQFEDKQYDE